jgi:hypothetical protein
MRGRGIRAFLLAVAVVLLCGAAQASAAETRPPALRLLTVSPKGPAPGDATIELRFSAPLVPLTARTEPKLSPAAAGSWSQPSPTTLAFTPSLGYLPGTVVHVTVRKGLASTDGVVLRRAVSASFDVENGSGVRLAQLLAELRYLPVHPTPPRTSRVRETPPGSSARSSTRPRAGWSSAPTGRRSCGGCGSTTPRRSSGARSSPSSLSTGSP